MKPPRAAALPWLLAALLAGCEAMPPPGETVTAQVVGVPRDRGAIEGGFTSLHAALRAGVRRADAERGRLWRAQCIDEDDSAADGWRGRTVTLVLPLEATPAVGALAEIDALQAAHATDRRRHGRFVRAIEEPGPDPAATSPAPDDSAAQHPGWRRSFDRWRPLCRTAGAPVDRWRVQLTGAVLPWEFDFAQAERARHKAFGDDEFVAGRVVRVSCQLKVIDGGDWTRPNWLARLPAGLAVREGDVVRLRTGGEEGGRASGPPAVVLDRMPHVPPPGGHSVVRCHAP